jgi:hypothetical protein
VEESSERSSIVNSVEENRADFYKGLVGNPLFSAVYGMLSSERVLHKDYDSKGSDPPQKISDSELVNWRQESAFSSRELQVSSGWL